MIRYEKKKGSINNKKYCPKCGDELSEVLRGLIPDDRMEQLRKTGKKYVQAGCMCFGDERDAKYICTNCRIEYSKDITPLEYISCPLEASNTIIKGDCINGELRTKRPYYSFLKNKEVICKMICPHMGTEVEIKTRRNKIVKGKMQRTSKPNVSCSREHVLIMRRIGEYEYEEENVLIEDILSVK